MKRRPTFLLSVAEAYRKAFILTRMRITLAAILIVALCARNKETDTSQVAGLDSPKKRTRFVAENKDQIWHLLNYDRKTKRKRKITYDRAIVLE